jgi:uncharacterized membrane protein
MKTEEFLAQVDEAAVVAAISAAEMRTSGEIRVYVSSKSIDDPIARATARFHKLKMHETRDRNGVLLYFAPRVQKFAVIGDSGIHAKCGQACWEGIAAEISAGLRDKQFTPAVVGAVKKLGEILAEHFPRESDDRDELSNDIVRD